MIDYNLYMFYLTIAQYLMNINEQMTYTQKTALLANETDNQYTINRLQQITSMNIINNYENDLDWFINYSLQNNNLSDQKKMYLTAITLSNFYQNKDLSIPSSVKTNPMNFEKIEDLEIKIATEYILEEISKRIMNEIPCNSYYENDLQNIANYFKTL